MKGAGEVGQRHIKIDPVVEDPIAEPKGTVVSKSQGETPFAPNTGLQNPSAEADKKAAELGGKTGGALGVHPAQLGGGGERLDVNVVLVGGPASGKGTQAKKLVEQFGLIHISTGDLLRGAKGTAIGDEAAAFMKDGQLVPDKIVLLLLEKKLAELDQPPRGFILDGFPRTIDQAKQLDKILKKLGTQIDQVVVLDVPGETLTGRIAGRRSCGDCGEVYHLENKPPKEPDCCDKCKSSPLVQREDDTVEKVKVRIEKYENQTAEVIPFFGSKVQRLNGNRAPDEVAADVSAQLLPKDVSVA